jgi:hypothetical protein
MGARGLDAWLKSVVTAADLAGMGTRIAKIATYLRSNTLALLALFVALGGTSYAAANGLVAKNGQLAGCVAGNGALKVLKPGHRCAKGQTAVAWNVTGRTGDLGPVGPVGAAGARGTTGDAGSPGQSGQSIVGSIGPVGPSDAYTSKSHGSPISLPAGDYVLFAKARWLNGQKAESRELFCELTDSEATIDSERVDVEADSFATVILGGPVHLASADKVSVACSEEERPVDEGSLKIPELTAIHVGTLHEQ